MFKVEEIVTSASEARSDAGKVSVPRDHWITRFRDAPAIVDATTEAAPDGGTILVPATAPSAISWIGSLQLFFLMFIGAYSGSIADSGYFRATCIFGAFFFVLGVFMTSICTRFWQLLLAHGVCTGIGNGFIFIPSVSTASTYFSKRRNLALSLMFCGSAIGGMLLPVIFGLLIQKVGFGWAMRIFSFSSAAIFAIAILLMRKRLPPKDDIRILTFEALKDRAFVLFVIGFFANFLGLFFAFFYLPSFARGVLGLDFISASNLLLVINGIGLPGRILPVWLADQGQWKGVRPLTVILPVNMVTGIMLFALIGIKTGSSAYVFAIIYGLFAAGIQILFPASLAEMTTDTKKSGAQIGWGSTIYSFACLLGNPIGGLILQATHNNYLYPQIYSGICLLIGCSIIAAAAQSKIKSEAGVQSTFV